MKVRSQLLALARTIADECEHNAPFRKKVEDALGSKERRKGIQGVATSKVTRPHRRTPAVLDPVSIAKTDEFELRRRLKELDIEQLKDVVAQYGMDPSKLVMKWKDSDRIVDHIFETSMTRATKGDAFR